MILRSVARARRQTAKNGLFILVGTGGRAIGNISLEGQVIIHGEIWIVHAKQSHCYWYKN